MSDGRRRVIIAPAAQRQIRRLPPGDAARLRAPILALGTDPRPPGSTKLGGSKFWRLRIGDLRVVCAIEREVVVILKAARRSESTYRRLER